MNRSILLIPIIIIIATLSATAQNIQLPTEYLRNSLNGQTNVPENVEGSPFLHEAYKQGSVTIGDKTFTTMVRYNALEDSFEIRNDEGESTSLLRRPGIIVQIGEDNYTIEPYLDDNGSRKQAYFKHLNNGETLLLLKEDVIFTEAVKARNSYGRDKPASLDPSESYYIKKSKSPAEEVTLRRKNILRFLDDDRVKDFVKENKMRFKDEAEVIETLEFYDSL